MKQVLYTLIAIAIATTSYSQTLDEQFESLKEDSETFKSYKVIDQSKLNAFWNMTMDSVRNLKAEKATIANDSKSKDNTITDINSTLETKNAQIEELETQISTIEVFGLDVSKSSFIFFSFFTIGALIIVLAGILYKYKDNNRIARVKVKEYEKLHHDFEEYKRTALDKQMKLRRDLQTERNKLEEARN
ncbi:hypothetical protein E1176_09115 [Fulvivirga sp. RKSG066]|uniref:hypothetical protein n=1 Tax=Fulvivirga aurantia TaxID=2529383 RepID=UPI0012BB6830|nr:hypothetical protein [Fulvivirga aurantia]MTI21177.1 hypothetical protein [Fulvivirga aurantia]